MSDRTQAGDAINAVHHKDFLHNTLPDKCANLIISDPPYFEVKGDFDFIWKSFEDYLKDVEQWAVECKRILAENGTLFWFGASKKIAYSQILLDKHFRLINNLVWEKAETGGLFGASGSEKMRSFPNSTERILMYSNDYEPGEWEQTGWDRIMEEKIKPRHPFANYLRGEFERAGISISDVRKFVVRELGFDSAMINRWLEGSSIMKPDIYRKFQDWMNGEYLRAEYEELRAEYEELRRPFNNFSRSTEVIKVRFGTPEFEHETVKPEKLSRILILTTSRPGDLVVVPFAGSGTECAMAAQEGRQYVGFEIEKQHADTASARAAKAAADYQAKPKLFTPDQQYTFKQAELFNTETLEK